MAKKVAIVGSGCSGIAALWALTTSTEHEVHLFEAAARLGGHTNTVRYEGPRGLPVAVDTGFIVMNTATYPNFLAFLTALGIRTAPTAMTFGVSRDHGTFEWAGTSLASIFAQRRNLWNPRMWRMILEIVRFNEFALDVLRAADEGEANPAPIPTQGTVTGDPPPQSLGDYLDAEGYSAEFRDNYLIPMTAAVWSTSPDKCSLEFPVLTLVRFMYNHHLLSTLARRPGWLTIPGGARQYVDAVVAAVPAPHIHLQAPVTALTPLDDTGAVRLTANGQEHVFDHVILATHGDQALDILRPVATAQEVEILREFRTSRNVAVLHADPSLMPRRRTAWAAWNYLTQTPFPPTGEGKGGNIAQVCLTYWMNLLQHIPEDRFGPVLVTLNPLHMPDPRLAHGIWEYAHPLYTAAAIRAQARLPLIQNTRGISYCGAWTKYGFHEDGFTSGLAAAVHHLGATLPFPLVDSTFSRGSVPPLTLCNHLLRLVILCVHIAVLLATRAWLGLLAVIDRRVAVRRKLS